MLFSLCFNYASPGVLINEVFIGDTDWIELYNAEATTQTLTNWQIQWWDELLGSGVFTIPECSLSPGAYLLLKEGDGVTSESNVIFMHNDIKWAELRGGACALVNSSGEGKDFVRWGNSSTPPPAGTSWTGINPLPPISNSKGHSLARDRFSTDTDEATNWDNACGIDAEHPTPGYRNWYFKEFDSALDFSEWSTKNFPGVFTSPRFAVDPAGGLIIHASDNTNCYGFWFSNVDAVPVKPDYLYCAEFDISTSISLPLKVPSFAIRLNPQNQQLIGILLTNSVNGGAVEPQPPELSKTYQLYFYPPQNAAYTKNEMLDDITVAFEMYNFDPTDEPEGAIVLDALRITLIPIQDLQNLVFEHRFNFESGNEGWQFHSVPIYTSPTASWSDGSLILRANDNTNTFGYWSRENILSLRSDRLYCCRFLIGCDQTDATLSPSIRLRAHTGDFQIASILVINSTDDGANSPSLYEDKEYSLYFLIPDEVINSPGTADQLILAFDIINFEQNDAPNASIMLQDLFIYSYEIPRYP